jgi:hypothetical protein
LVFEIGSGAAEWIGKAEVSRHQIRRPEELLIELPDGIATKGGVRDGIGGDQGNDYECAQDGDEPDLQRHEQPQMPLLTPESHT